MNQQSVAKFANFPVTRHRHRYNRDQRIGLLCAIRHFLLLDYEDWRSRGRGSRDEKQDTRSHEPDGQEVVENYKVVERGTCVEHLTMLIPSTKRSRFRANWPLRRNGPLKKEMQQGNGKVERSNKKGKSLRVTTHLHFHFPPFPLPFVSLFFRCLYILTFTTGSFVKRFCLGYIIYVRHSHSDVIDDTSPDLR